MKKNFKRTLAKVMAVALTVSMVGVASTDADAAKKIKLSSKSISVAKGATKKVTIKNVKAKKVKKLTVKSADKKIATVKKSGKTAIKVTGKKAGKSTKVTVKVKVGKKTTKLTLKVKVTKAKKVVPTTAPTTAPTATPAASASATPAASASTTPSIKPSATPTASASATPSATPVATEPAQPEPPTTEAKQLPEVNLRRDNVPAWVLKGSYCTALFNTDDTVSYSSKPWKADGNVYNNGIIWYIDSAKKGQVDLSAYSEVALTIKTDAEVKLMTWGGSADAEDFWSKNDIWGNTKSVVENEDGSKTITYDIKTAFGNENKVKKAVAIGFTLKSASAADESVFEEKTATVYSIKFIKNGSAQPETPDPETPGPETPKTDTASTETPDQPQPSTSPAPEPTKAPAAPIKTLDNAGFTSFTDIDGVDYDSAKTYTKVVVKFKAYNINGDLVTAEDENYGAFQGYSKLTLGTLETCSNDNGAGFGDGIATCYLNNAGKSFMAIDEEGYFTTTFTVPEGKTTADLTGLGFQSTTNAAGIPKIDIYSITFVE